MNLVADAIPESLRKRCAWVLWKEVERNGHLTKVPFTTTGIEAKSTDPMTWNTFGAVVEKLGRSNHDGIGFVFDESFELVGIDLDGCRNPITQEWAPWAREVIERFNSYTELSPSRTGAKIFCRGKSPFATGKNIKLPDAPVISAKHPGIEVYHAKRYFCVTGRKLPNISGEVEERQDAIDWLAEKYGKPRAQQRIEPTETSVADRARKYLERMPFAVSGSGGHNATFRVACVLVLGFGLSLPDAKSLMQEWNAGCEPPWSDYELDHKLSDASKQGGQRNYLRDSRPDQWDSIAIPNYPAPAIKPEVHVTTLADASRKYLDVVAKGGLHLIELGLPDLDHAIGGGVEAGEMIIFAARPSHGKSMAAQQVVYHFTERTGPALFVSEEMSALALGKRAIQFASDVPVESWQDRASLVAGDVDALFDGKHPCYILEGCRTADRVAEEIERAVAEQGVKLAIVDYVQLLSGKGRGRYEEITGVSIALKQVAQRCKIPLIVLAQMSRTIEGRKGGFVPMMSDLKETGQLEQDADVIVFQVWPHRLDSKEDPRKYQLFVCKNRNRPINATAIECQFEPGRQRLVKDGAEHAPVADYQFGGSEGFGFSSDFSDTIPGGFE